MLIIKAVDKAQNRQRIYKKPLTKFKIAHSFYSSAHLMEE